MQRAIARPQTMQYGIDYSIGAHSVDVPSSRWSELRCIEAGRGGFGDSDGISALALDCTKELIWLGTNSGMLHAHLASDLKRIVSVYLGSGSFSFSGNGVSDVRSLAVASTNVLAAVPRGLCVLSRGGVTRSTLFADTLADPRALALNPVLEGQVCVGGASEKLAVVDWEIQRILRQASQRVPSTVTAAQWSVFPNAHSMAIIATQTGRISLCDPSSMREVQAAAAFTGSVTSISFHGNTIAATGCTSHGGVAYPQQLIKLFDVRYFNSPLPSVPFTAGPILTAFDSWTSEAFCGGAAEPLWGLSPTGNLQCFDISSGQSFPALSPELQLDSGMDAFTCMAVSSQGLIVLGDSGGYIHQWAANNYAQINAESEPVFLRPISKGPVTRSDSDLSRHLNRMLTSDSGVTIPRFLDQAPEQDPSSDYLTSVIFSHMDIPDHKKRRPYPNPKESGSRQLYEWAFTQRPWARFPQRLSDHILTNAKRQGSVAYARAPPGFVRNSMVGHKPDPMVVLSAKRRPRIYGSQSPRSGKDRSPPMEGGTSSSQLDANGDELVENASIVGLSLPSVRSKFVEIDLVAAEKINGFDFQKYNRSGLFCGLENALSNVYVNAAVQALYFTPPLRHFMLKHACSLEGCITCELGFVFHMIDLGGPGMACEAGNFTKAFMKMANADALGLLDGKTSLPPSQRMENFTRYLLEQLHKDDKNAGESVVSQLLGGEVFSFGCFMQSRTEWARPSRPFQHTLVYSSNGKLADSFCELLENSLSRDLDVTRAYCETSKEFETMSQRRELKTLPNMLLLGCNTKVSQSVAWWCDVNSTSFGGSGVESIRAPSSETELERVAQETMKSPGRLLESIRVEIEGQDIRVTNLEEAASDMSEDGERSFGFDSEEKPEEIKVHSGQSTEDDTQAEYDLSFVIAYIPPTSEEAAFSDGVYSISGNQQGHLVSYIKVPESYKDQKIARGVVKPHDIVNRTSIDEHEQEPQWNGIASGSSGEAQAVDERVSCKWYCFNDFVITPCDGFEEVRAFDPRWKVPCLLAYVRRDVGARMEVYGDKKEECRHDVREVIGSESKNRAVGLFDDEETPGPGTLFALDCEFVMTARDEAEIWGDGTRRVVSPAKMALGRVSVIRASGPRKGLPIIDDYVHVTEGIVDYLTRYSGLKEGDCDPNRSSFTVNSLKTVYKRLRCLVDVGCVFIGHGLKKDFRIINFVVPPHQVIDTVVLYRAARKRLLGLRFLTTTLLRDEIQTTTHDSIEDADAAMRLYDLYKRICKDGSDPIPMKQFSRLLQTLYSYGFQHNFRADAANPFDMEAALISPL